MTRLKLFCMCLAGSMITLGAVAAESASQPKGGKEAKPGSFQIRSLKYRELLRPEEASSADGTRIVLYPAQTWKCLTWKFHANGESLFQVHPVSVYLS